LADRTTTCDADKNIDLVGMPNVLEGLNHQPSFHVGDKVFFEGTVIDSDLAIAWSDPNTSNGSLTTSGTKAITADFVFLCEHAGFSLRSFSDGLWLDYWFDASAW
jgi:hypothetical protein